MGACPHPKVDDVTEAVEAMMKILTDPITRSGLVKKGLERAKIFSWKSNALNLLECYRRVCSEGVKA